MAWLADTMARMPLWLALALAGILAILLIAIGVAVVRQRRGPADKQRKKRQRKAEADLTTALGGCRRFHRRLTEAFPGRRGRYRLPLYVVVGPSRDAIAHTVRRAGLARPLGEPVSAGGLTWTAFDRGATVEVDPAVLFDSGRGDRWDGLIRSLQRHRPERPLDGVIVVLPATELTGEGALDADALRAEAEAIRTRLGAMQNGLGMTLPVHAVVAESETLHGFPELGSLLDPDHLDHPLGYTQAWGESEGYNAAHVDRAVDHVSERIDALVLESLSAGREPGDRDSAFLLPNAVAALNEPLRAYFDALFQGGQYARLAGLRGIYFAGAVHDSDGYLARRPSFAAGALHDRIFPEYTLAEPASGFLVSHNRDVRRAQAGLAVLILLGGTGLLAADRILANRVPQLESLTQAIGQDYRRVRVARSQGDVDGSLISEDTIGFLRRAANLDGFFLRSLAVPSSWIAQLPRDLERLQEGAYVEILFKSIRSSLREHARRVTNPETTTRDLARDGGNGRAYPDHAMLDGTLERYSRLIEHLDHYDSLRRNPSDAFALRRLVDFLYDLELPAEFDPEIAADTGRGEGLLLSPLPAAQFARQAQASFLQRFDSFTGDLVGRHDVQADLRGVAEILRGEVVVAQDRRVAMTRLQTLRSTLTRLKRLFQQGTYDWVAGEGGELDERFAALLQRVEQHPLLGDKVVQRMRRQMAGTRQSFAASLSEVRVPDLGPLVAVNESSVRLSPAAQSVLERLQQFDLGGEPGPLRAGAFPQPLKSAVGQAQPPTIPASPRDGRHIQWRVDMLKAGRRVLERIDSASLAEGESRAVTRTLRAIVRSEKLTAVSAAVAQAARERPDRVGDATAAAESRLRQRIANFDAARDVISDILFHLDDMGAYSLRREIARLAGGEALALLRRVSAMRAADQVYPVDKAALQNWDGRPGLGRRLFNVDSKRQLNAFLAKQRSRMTTLAEEFAGPARAFISNHADIYRPADTATVVRWQAVSDALVRYRNDAPTSAVARLEDYIADRLNRVSTDNCRLAHPGAPAEGETFFDQRLRWLSQTVLERCRTLKRREVHTAYGELARYFSANLAGRVPFTEPGEARAADPAAPAAVAEFIDRFDRAMNDGIGEARFWPSSSSVPRFLARMDRAVAALRPALSRDGERHRVRYELETRFRVNRDAEVAGDHVLNWRFRSGDSRITLFDGDRTIPWQTGDKIALALDWAKNAPTRPMDAGGRPGYSRSKRTARFTQGGRWSLFAVIARHATRDDSKPGHRLAFTVPLAHTSAGADETDARIEGGRARLFMRLTLRAGGEVVELPRFPVEAPDAPKSTARDGEPAAAEAARTQADTRVRREEPRFGGGPDERTELASARERGDDALVQPSARGGGAPADVRAMDRAYAGPGGSRGAPAEAATGSGDTGGAAGDARGTDAPDAASRFLTAGAWRRDERPGAESARTLYVQAAAFRREANAERMRARLRGVGEPFIQEATVDSQRFYRVRLGPYQRPEAVEAVLGELADAGIQQPGVIVR